MERLSLKTGMFMLTLLGVIAPATNIMANNSASMPGDDVTQARPTLPGRTAFALKAALSELLDTGDVPAGYAQPSSPLLPATFRDPFQEPRSASAPHVEEVPLPSVSVLGLVQSSSGAAATLEIAGNIVTLRDGESSMGVTLSGVFPPDTVVIRFARRVVTLRVM